MKIIKSETRKRSAKAITKKAFKRTKKLVVFKLAEIQKTKKLEYVYRATKLGIEESKVVVNQPADMYYCSFCKQTLYNQFNWLQHTNGKRHQKKQETMRLTTVKRVIFKNGIDHQLHTVVGWRSKMKKLTKKVKNEKPTIKITEKTAIKKEKTRKRKSKVTKATEQKHISSNDEMRLNIGCEFKNEDGEFKNEDGEFKNEDDIPKKPKAHAHTQSKNYQCPWCKFQFTSPQGLRYHMLIGRCSCEKCGFLFETNYQRAEHYSACKNRTPPKINHNLQTGSKGAEGLFYGLLGKKKEEEHLSWKKLGFAIVFVSPY